MIYFAQSGKTGPVKIGSASDPAARLRSLQTGNGSELRLLATMPGGQKIERSLHRVLAPTKVRGEWFKLSPALCVLLECVEKGVDLSPLLSLMEQEVRVIVKRETPRPKRKLKLSKAERERRSREAKKRHREGKLGGSRYGKLGGRPSNDSRTETALKVVSGG